MLKYIIAFGDIHGCFKAAATAVSLAEQLKVKAIFLGDYVDRGPSGIKVLKAIIEAKRNHTDWVFLRGNHEQILLNLIECKSNITDIGSVFDGKNKFLYSQTKETFEEWQSLSHFEQNEIYQFLKHTPFYYELENLVFTHAILIENNLTLSEKSEEEFLWSYGTDKQLWDGKPFIHGHYLTKRIAVHGKATNINTECGYGGYLTGLLVDEKKGDVIKSYTISEDGKLNN